MPLESSSRTACLVRHGLVLPAVHLRTLLLPVLGLVRSWQLVQPGHGGYGSRSVWYGPYGGYSYTQGYNPRTGRYGYVETGWDGDEWESHGEKYNPRTGIGTKTERYYDEDKNPSKPSARSARRRIRKTDRTTDFDDGTTTVERETSQGGSSEVQRSRDGGTVSSERTVTPAGWQHVHRVRRTIARAGLEHDHGRRWIDHDEHRAQ